MENDMAAQKIQTNLLGREARLSPSWLRIAQEQPHGNLAVFADDNRGEIVAVVREEGATLANLLHLSTGKIVETMPVSSFEIIERPACTGYPSEEAEITDSATFELGDRVIFGRARGEQTRGIVRKINAKSLKIEAIENRGSKDNRAAGTIYRVHPSMVKHAKARA